MSSTSNRKDFHVCINNALSSGGYAESMRVVSKQLQSVSNSRKTAQLEAREDVRRAIEKGDIESARSLAENVIRRGYEATTSDLLAARLEKCAAKLAHSECMKGTRVPPYKLLVDLDPAIIVEKFQMLWGTLNEIEKFVGYFEEGPPVAEETMDSGVTTAISQEQIDTLVQQVAGEMGLDAKEILALSSHHGSGNPEEKRQESS